MTVSQEAHARLSARLAARTAHELNNLAAILSGHIYLLSRASESPAQALEAFGKAMAYLDRITRSLSSIGALGLVEAELLDVNDVVRAATGSGSGFSPGMTELDLADDLPRLTARREDLVSALAALIANAREASLPSQRIRISTSRDLEAVITIAVEDSGQGVAPTIRRRNFEPFVTSKGEKGRGTGVTLATVATLLHRGSLAIEDRPEGGTRATLQIPLHPSPAG